MSEPTIVAGPASIPPKMQAALDRGDPLKDDGSIYTGKGKAPAIVRARCSEAFWDRIELLERIADGVEEEEVVTKLGVERRAPAIRDRLTALGMLGKYGGLEKIVLEGGLSDDAAELLALAREARERAALPYVPPRPIPAGGSDPSSALPPGRIP